MAGFNLYMSNSLDRLAGMLGEVVRVPLSSPFARETIMVHNRGMQRWVSMRLSSLLGVWANCRYPFPNELVHELFRAAFSDIPEKDPYRKDVMTWRVMGLVPGCTGLPGFEPIRDYLGGVSSPMRRFQLSREIADSFDQYLTYRHEMVLSWEGGCEDHWQAELWRRVRERIPYAHKAQLHREFIARLRGEGGEISGLPERISVFGISNLPPFHLELLRALSERIPVNLFIMNPSREYWGDVRSPRAITKMKRRAEGSQLTFDDLHYETGNSLLASLGMRGKEFIDMVIGAEPVERYDDGDFIDPRGQKITLLNSIQHDIFALVDRGSGKGEDDGRIDLDGDASVQVVSCHGPMREIEALHDYLLGCFEALPGLEPHDILVMTPDIETYLPYIKAVFGNPEHEARAIPFTLADQTVRWSGRTVDAFLAILGCNDTRFTVEEVLGLLDCDDIARRFGITGDGPARVREWVIGTGVRWGIDERDRMLKGLPAFRENTWRAGEDRMLLGYAMRGGGRLFGEVLPFDRIEGASADLLGRFLSFTDTLFAFAEELKKERPLAEWAELLGRLLDGMFEPDGESEALLQALRGHLSDLSQMGGLSGFTGDVDVAVVRQWLSDAIDGQRESGRFLSGGVTFCTMLPMRSIPFRVVCLVGMNDGTFPRTDNPVGFNLMRDNPLRGDRSSRNDDRYIFLEALVSARECLYISYVGQSMMDNKDIPPSVLVSELLDYADRGYTIGGKPVRERIVVKHRLQSFSAAYFRGDGPLYSYSEENLKACRASAGYRPAPAPFIIEPLPVPEEESLTLGLEDLVAFFENPCRALLRRRLGIYYKKGEEAAEDHEPFALGGLERYQLEQDLCRLLLAGEDRDAAYRLYRASGALPHGSAGRYGFDKSAAAVHQFVGTLSSYMKGERRGPLDIDYRGEGFRITGRVGPLWSDTLLFYRHANVKAKDRLRAWITHCVAAAEMEGLPARTVLAGKDCVWEAGRVEGPAGIVADLVKLYRQGMSFPLCFFPETSLAYAAAVAGGKDENRALGAARGAWGPAFRGSAECDDPYFSRCFSASDPLGGGFVSIARAVFDPMIDCQRKVKS